MSIYGVHKVCHLLQVDTDFRARFQADPTAAIAVLPLSDEERAAVAGGDVAALYRLGAHTFLLSRIPRFAANVLDRDTYIERMRTVLSPEEPAEVEAASKRLA